MEAPDGWRIVELLWDALTGLLGGYLMIQIKRIDELARNSPTREEMDKRVREATDDTRKDVENRFNNLQKSIDDTRDETRRTREELRSDMRDHRQESREILGRIFERLDATADRKASGK